MNKYKVSVITGIGAINKYLNSIRGYFENIQCQSIFKWTEHIIIYKEWSKIFDDYSYLPNIIFVHESGNGVYDAWNQGIKTSTTKFITNWNVDDRRFVKANEKKYIFLMKNPDHGLIYNWWYFTDKEDEDINKLQGNIRPFQSTPKSHQMWSWSCACGADPMWRKDLHKKVGYFDQKNYPSCGDWDMWLSFDKVTKIGQIQDYLSIFFINPVGVGQNNERERYKQDRAILEKHNVNIPDQYLEKWYPINE
jgi:O-antigen biosynthesis protein